MTVSSPSTILVIITRRIGDVLLVTPLLRSLKLAWPDAALDVLVFDNTRGILAGNPDIRHIITIPERPTLGQHLRLLMRLWHRYDLALSTLAGDRPTLYAWLAGKRRIGLLSPAADQAWKRRLLDSWAAFDNVDTHTVNMYLALADLLGIDRRYDITLAWTARQADHVKTLVPAGRYAVFHVYPKFAYKTWVAHEWSTLAHWLSARGVRVVLTGSADQDELRYIADLLPGLPADTLNLAGQLSFGEVAFLLSGASAYVGPDTAVTHIAAAVGTPTVALFGPSNPVKWGPWPKDFAGPANPYRMQGSQHVGNVMLLQGEGNCVPCFQEGCQRHIDSLSDCLQHMRADTVIAAVDAMLQ